VNDNIEQIIYTLSKKKDFKSFMEWLEEECCGRFTGDNQVKSYMQMGKHNLYLDVLDMVSRGDIVANKGKGE
jgi:hypothetical protein